MTIVEFFKDMSLIVEEYRIKKINREKAFKSLSDLEENAKNEGINYKIDIDKLLDDTVDGEYDEEMSYDPYEDEEESSYEDDEESSY